MKRLLFCLMVIVLMVGCDTMRYGVDRSKVMRVWVNGELASVDLLMEKYGEEEVYVKMVCGSWDTVVALGDGANVRCDMLEHELKIYGAVEGLRCSLRGRNFGVTLGLDVSGNSGLQELNCGYEPVETLILGELPMLKHLDCHDNFYLTELDVSGFSELRSLDCSICKLTELDVSNCPKLERLECSVNNLRQLDVSQNGELTYLSCMGNELEELDVSRCTKLEFLTCESNKLRVLDVSNNREIERLFCEDNCLRKLDVSGHPKLHKLRCFDNQLEELNVSDCPELWELLCMRNKLTELDVSGNKNLWHLGYEGNMIEEVDWVNEEAAKGVEFVR